MTYFPAKVYLTKESKKEALDIKKLLSASTHSAAIRYCIKFTHDALIKDKSSNKKNIKPDIDPPSIT